MQRWHTWTAMVEGTGTGFLLHLPPSSSSVSRVFFFFFPVPPFPKAETLSLSLFLFCFFFFPAFFSLSQNPFLRRKKMSWIGWLVRVPKWLGWVLCHSSKSPADPDDSLWLIWIGAWIDTFKAKFESTRDLVIFNTMGLHGRTAVWRGVLSKKKFFWRGVLSK